MTIDGKAYRTYSARVTVALLCGDRLTPELLSPRQREAYDCVAKGKGGREGIRAPQQHVTALEQLRSIAMVESPAPGVYCIPRSQQGGPRAKQRQPQGRGG